MKESEIKHILDTGQEGDRTLVFTHVLDGPAMIETDARPEDWKNVRYLTQNIYYAWDNLPDSGEIFHGELV